MVYLDLQKLSVYFFSDSGVNGISDEDSTPVVADVDMYLQSFSYLAPARQIDAKL